MEDNDDNKIRSLIHHTIDADICMDCEHPRCASKEESLFRQAKALVTEEREKTASDIFALANKYAMGDKTSMGSEEIEAHHYFNAINEVGKFGGR